MSSDVVARAKALEQKALELERKGHLVRAADYYGRAAEAARALGADNLVLLDVQLAQANALNSYAAAAADMSSDPRIYAAHSPECIALLSGVVKALERRRLVDTLLDGKCTVTEELWSAAQVQRSNPHYTAGEAASWAVLFGYQLFLNAGTYALHVLAHALRLAVELSDEHSQLFAQQAVRAAEVMKLPRRHGHLSMEEEAQFVDIFRWCLSLIDTELDARRLQPLAVALRRLERCGVLQARKIEDALREFYPEQQAYNATALQSLTAPDRRSCALDSCGVMEAHPAHFKCCAACRSVVYCSPEHQAADWPSHKSACKAARKARSEQAGPSGA